MDDYKFSPGDEVVVVKSDEVIRENLYVGRELIVHSINKIPNGKGYDFIIDGEVKFLWESELRFNKHVLREKRLKELLSS